MNVLSLSLSLSLSVAPALAQTGPFTQLEASYPWGDQTCSAPTPDNTRLFVAPGAAISVLDVTNLSPVTTPTVLDRFEIPECSPLAMKYFAMDGANPGQVIHRLFIAGGTLGVWEVELCAALFAANPPPPPVCSYSPTRIDQIGMTQQWKRCLDVAVVEGNAAATQTPLLFALFAARADSVALPTELRAYKLEPSGAILAWSTFVFPNQFTAPAAAAGRSIGVDPADPDHVYVAMGVGGLWRVDISSATFTAAPMTVPSCPLLSSCNAGEEVRFIDIVSTSTLGSVLYAVLEYGRIAEYLLATGPSPTPTVIPVPCQAGCTITGNSPCSFTERVAVEEFQDGRLLLVVAADSRPARLNDTRAPYRTNGIWSDLCVAPGVPDPNGVVYPFHGHCQSVFCMRRDLSSSPPQTQTFESHAYGEYWGTLKLQRAGDGDSFRLYETTNVYATSVRTIEIDLQQNRPMGGGAGDGPIQLDDTPKVKLVGFHIDQAFPAADGDVSTLNPGMTYFGLDGAGATLLEATMLYIRSPPAWPTWDIVPVTGTLGVCGDQSTLPCGLEPNPYFSNSVFNAAHWPDPDAPTTREIFFPGTHTFPRTLPFPNCGVDLLACGDPCSMNPRPGWIEDHFELSAIGLQDDPSAIGWRYQKFTPGTGQPTGGPGGTLNVEWFQLPAPTNNPGEKSDLVDYTSSELHPSGTVINAVRSGAKFGGKFYDVNDIDIRAQASCSGGGGFGERLPQTGWPTFHEVLTHIEREDPGTGNPLDVCKISLPCIQNGLDRHLINTRSKTFQVEISEGVTRWITIICAGHIAADPGIVQPSACQWDQFSGKGQLVIYDTTDTAGPGFSRPTLLRVALGLDPATPAAESSFWSVDVKTYPPESEFEEAKTYAFVADLFGKIQIFDVSPSELFPPVNLPYFPAGASSPSKPILVPKQTVEFEPEPADGLRPNCVDIEIDDNTAYVAIGKGGVAILNVTQDPTLVKPPIIGVIDTPGVVLGVTFRRENGVPTHLVVGDTRCGMHLYRRGP